MANTILHNESIPSSGKKIIVLGSGPNRIGQGIEFDYCCVHGLLAIKEAGKRLRKFRGRSFASLLEEDWVLHREFLTIDLAPFLRRAHERLKRLEAARGMVVSDPEGAIAVRFAVIAEQVAASLGL
jgi:hypothetical protein